LQLGPERFECTESLLRRCESSGDGGLLDLAAAAISGANSDGAAATDWQWLLAGPGAALDGLPARLAWESRQGGYEELQRNVRGARPEVLPGGVASLAEAASVWWADVDASTPEMRHMGSRLWRVGASFASGRLHVELENALLVAAGSREAIAKFALQ